MKRLALAAAGAVVVGLAGCSQAAAPATASGATPTRAGAASTAPSASCSRQYQAWEQDKGKKLIAVLNDVSSAVTAGDAHLLSAALKKARPAVPIAASHPMPACVDRKGYWTVLLMHVNAVASGRSSRSSVRAAMAGVPEIVRQLMAEVKRSSG
jgi:hypothetical protein